MSFLQDKIYPLLPVALQNAGISAFGYTWHKRRFGGNFSEYLHQFKDREAFTAAQWHDYQTGQMRKMLLHAFKHVPHYQQVLSNAGFTETSLSKFELDQLSRIPVLEKEELRQKGTSSLISKQLEKGGTFYSSSGSTGTPTRILYSHAMHQRISALYEARVRNWAGVSRTNARGMIGGRRVLPTADSKPPYYRYNFIEKQVYFSAYHLSNNTAANYLQGLQKHDVEYMVGYAMSNYLLAKFIKAEGLQAPQMKAVLTSSEKLTPAMRALISEVYNCKVYDGWSGVEWCGLISENEHGQLLISPDSALIEVIKPDGTPAAAGEEGELVCTGFLNYDQPLIRYKIGDVVKLSPTQQATCGRAFTVVDEIIGRTEDIIVAPDGRQMVRFHGIFIDLPNVVKAQVVQETVADFTVNVQTNGLTSEERNIISRRMESQLGNVKVNINEVNEIPVGINGKFKAVISKIKRNAA
jgi:phenylacetate-CoA ligase